MQLDFRSCDRSAERAADRARAVVGRVERAAATAPSSTGQSSQVSVGWEAAKCLVQGSLNIANGLQDMGIGLLNLPAMASNGVAKAEEALGILNANDPIRVPYIFPRPTGAEIWSPMSRASREAGPTRTAGASLLELQV